MSKFTWAIPFQETDSESLLNDFRKGLSLYYACKYHFNWVL